MFLFFLINAIAFLWISLRFMWIFWALFKKCTTKKLTAVDGGEVISIVNRWEFLIMGFTLFLWSAICFLAAVYSLIR